MLLHYYADMQGCIDPFTDREDAIVGVPELRVQTFRNEVILDVSSRQAELESEMFPLDIVLDPIATMGWQYDYIKNGSGEQSYIPIGSSGSTRPYPPERIRWPRSARSDNWPAKFP